VHFHSAIELEIVGSIGLLAVGENIPAKVDEKTQKNLKYWNIILNILA
jgi:hypothetical protein